MSYASVDAAEFVPQPRPMMMAKMATENASPIQDFAPAAVIVTAHVNALFTLKQ
jgi:hypothetical protein